MLLLLEFSFSVWLGAWGEGVTTLEPLGALSALAVLGALAPLGALAEEEGAGVFAGLKVGVHSLAETEGMNSLVGGFNPFDCGVVFTLLLTLLFTGRVLVDGAFEDVVGAEEEVFVADTVVEGANDGTNVDAEGLKVNSLAVADSLDMFDQRM